MRRRRCYLPTESLLSVSVSCQDAARELGTWDTTVALICGTHPGNNFGLIQVIISLLSEFFSLDICLKDKSCGWFCPLA